MTLSDQEWITKHLKPLMVAGKTLLAQTDTLPSKPPTYDKGDWTGLKLLLEKYYLKIYLDILGKRGYRVAYVDLFAGPGLNRIGKANTPIPGSPLIPIMISESKYNFSAFVFSETNSDYINALKKRIELAKGSILAAVEVFQEDANLVVKQLPNIMKKYDISHALVFIDPEGLQFIWSSMENLVKCIDCDLIINFPSVGVNRNLQNKLMTKNIREFLGPGSETIPPNADEEWALNVYRSNLGSVGKDISTEIKIDSGQAFHYHLIPAVRKTAGGSPWFDALREAKKRIERCPGPILRIIADQIDGRQDTLG